jgi:aspartate aminotransferase
MHSKINIFRCKVYSELREAVAKYTSKKKNYEYKAENIIIGPGSKELMFLLHVIFDGEIILPAPSWVSYAPQAILGRNKTHILETKRENNWFPTAEELEELILKDKNKNYLLFLNSPNNPSGQVCKNLNEISEVVKKYNLIILSDEIYSELTFDDDYQSISKFCPEKTIISTGLSKWCGAGGWRLGYFFSS